MNQKKILSAVIAGAMTATAFIGAMPSIVPGIGSIQASAASEETVSANSDVPADVDDFERYDADAWLKGDTVKGNAGDTVKVPVFLMLDDKAEPKSIWGIGLKAVYDTSALELTDISEGEGFINKGALTADVEKGIMLYQKTSEDIEIDPDRPVFILEFRIKDDTALGTYPVKLVDHLYGNMNPMIVHTSAPDNEAKYYTPHVGNGTVIVNGPVMSTPAVTTTISSEETTTVTTPVTLKPPMPDVFIKNRETKGTCGDDLTWELDDEGTLTISGIGDMQKIGDTFYASPSAKDAPFSQRTDIKKIIISEGVTSISDWAFEGCYDLTEITIPKSVKSIGYRAFYFCRNLKSINIPEGVTKIEANAFEGCSRLKSVSLPEGVTEIKSYTFSGCDFTEITIPDSVTRIDACAFNSCDFTEITIPKGVTRLDGGAFSGCHELENIKVSADNERYTDIDGVLYNKNKTKLILCPIGKKYREYIVPDGVTTIDEGAFGGSSIKTISLPESVTNIKKGAFSGCRSLKTINIPDSVTSIGEYTFSYCNALESINIPDRVTSIGGHTFKDCENLKSLTIGSGVTSIDEYAFENCKNLTSLTIPEGVKSIGVNAFFDCSGLESITIYSPDCEIEYYIPVIPDNAVIYGYKNSTAQAFAEKNGYKFEPLDDAPKQTAPAKVSAPTVSADGTVTWTAAENAVYYRVAKYANGKLYYGPKTTDTSYKLSKVPTTDYIVCIIAYGDDGSNTVGEKVKVNVEKPLGYVNKVTVDENGVVSWKKAENATAYRVVKAVNGKNYYGPKVTDTSYKLVAVPKKDYEIFVISYDEEGKNSLGRQTRVEVGDLGVVFDPKVDKDGKVTWSAARGAVKYKVGKTVGTKTVYSAAVTDTTYTLKSKPTKDYKVFIVAFDENGNKTFGVKKDVKVE